MLYRERHQIHDTHCYSSSYIYTVNMYASRLFTSTTVVPHNDLQHILVPVPQPRTSDAIQANTPFHFNKWLHTFDSIITGTGTEFLHPVDVVVVVGKKIKHSLSPGTSRFLVMRINRSATTSSTSYIASTSIDDYNVGSCLVLEDLVFDESI